MIILVCIIIDLIGVVASLFLISFMDIVTQTPHDRTDNILALGSWITVISILLYLSFPFIITYLSYPLDWLYKKFYKLSNKLYKKINEKE